MNKYKINNNFFNITYKLNKIIALELEQLGGKRSAILDNTNINNFINNEFPKICKKYDYIPSKIPAVERIVVFGDIHGDYEYAKELLEMSGVAKFDPNNDDVKWIGRNTYVVQVGDQIDRCRPIGNMQCNNPLTTHKDEASDIKILKLFNELHKQAIKPENGGAVISLLGNHEIMNSMGQLNYVSYLGLEEFEDYKDKENPNLVFGSGTEARAYAFQPGHEYGKLLGCSRAPAIIIGHNLFVHAGLVDGLINEIEMKGFKDFESICVAIRKWLLCILDISNVKDILVGSNYSMFWTRILGNLPTEISLDDPRCNKNINTVLNMFELGNGAIIIGHTPQSFIHNHNINGTCSGKVWRVDNGSSKAFDGFDQDIINGHKTHNRRAQYLEILNDKEYIVHDTKQK